VADGGVEELERRQRRQDPLRPG